MEKLLSRRSIRRFKDAPVEEGALNRILEAAMAAPSAGNEQPWHFVVVEDREILDGIMEFHPYSKMLAEAPFAILVCGDPDLERFKGYWTQDCAAATENMLLAIHSLGLGGVWLGVYPEEERIAGMRRLLSIPEGIMPFSLVALGHPNETKPAISRFNPNRVHRDCW